MFQTDEYIYIYILMMMSLEVKNGGRAEGVL